MASRRTRIKGIANIPQRRKNNASEEKNNENDNLTNAQDEEKEINKQPLIDSANKLDDTIACESINQSISEEVVASSDTNNESVTKPTENQISTPNIETEATVIPQPTEPVKPLKRRTFIKPLVSAAVINRKPRQNIEKEQLEATNVEETPSEINKIETTDKSAQQDLLDHDPKEKQVTPKGVSNVGHEITLDEVHLTPTTPVIGVPEEVPLDRSVKKILPQTNNAPNSDTEYPPPPPSPSKINRSRIKAIPRLGYRKTSFSASESEDESRRNYNRNRNDSVCSTASGVPESIADCFSPQRPKDFTSTIPKKCNRTEQSRKLAEARREFQRRFGTNKPDRQRLTMIDLIFYNPTSNPMTEVKSKPDRQEVEEVNMDEVEAESKKIDDPQPETVEEAGKSDEENEIPVPQIKIGPSGEIILDEKSLVIENKEVKKQREELQKTKIVDGDFDTGYGIYKRQKRSKEWSQSETLRFYKALHTIGSDFTLMCELFPRRTRRELKQKFKKEEKINRGLIDKAVMEPCNFDYTELKHEVDMEEKELEELRKQKEEQMKLKQEKMEERQAKKRKAMEKAAQSEKDTEKTNAKPQEQSKPPVEPKPPKIRKVRKPRQRKLNIESVLEDSDADVSDIATQSESEDDEEILPPLQPTRSGRIPKVTRKFDTSEEYNLETSTVIRKKMPDPKTNANIEPGSIMVITEAGPNKEPVHKIYMVTAANNETPVNLNSEVVSNAIQLKKGITAQNILTISTNVTDDEAEKEEVCEENNVTIPADENVTTLRGNAAVCNGSIPNGSETYAVTSASIAADAVENMNVGPTAIVKTYSRLNC